MSKCLLIAEAGINHHGSLIEAQKLASIAKGAGAGIVKFQTYCPERAINPNHKDFAFLKSLALTHIDFFKLAMHCQDIGIEFLSTPGDVSSLKFLVEECGVKRIKIGSDDLTYAPLIEAAVETELPLILSTGMATMDELDAVLDTVPYEGVTLLHCVSAYPCRYEDANLMAIDTLRDYERLVGYSDHCKGTLACVVAASLGAVMIEKHFELAAHKGPDTEVSISQHILSIMIKRIREVELMLGTGIKEPCEAEKLMIPLVRKREDGRKMA